MLNIWVSHDLSWTKHINQVTTKSNNTLKFNKRNIQTNSRKLKEIAYKTYVRPSTEYAASVWDPWQKKYIHQLEMIQHRTLGYIFNDYSYTSSVSSMLSELNLLTIEKWRTILSLVMLYKIHHNPVKIPLHHDIQPSLRHRFIFSFSRINPHMYSFFPCTARLWNNLPPDIRTSPDLGIFWAGLLSTSI